ncbi:hypothetical protein GF324_02575 [bacterium]|nr:hypothetical protein [bacterium]
MASKSRSNGHSRRSSKAKSKTGLVSRRDVRKFLLLVLVVIVVMTVLPYTFMKARPMVYTALGKPVPSPDTTSIVYKMYHTDLRGELDRRVDTLKAISAKGIDLTDEQKKMIEEYQIVQGEVSSFTQWLFAKNTVYELIRDILLSMFFYFMGVLQGKARSSAAAAKT